MIIFLRTFVVYFGYEFCVESIRSSIQLSQNSLWNDKNLFHPLQWLEKICPASWLEVLSKRALRKESAFRIIFRNGRFVSKIKQWLLFLKTNACPVLSIYERCCKFRGRSHATLGVTSHPQASNSTIPMQLVHRK